MCCSGHGCVVWILYKSDGSCPFWLREGALRLWDTDCRREVASELQASGKLSCALIWMIPEHILQELGCMAQKDGHVCCLCVYPRPGGGIVALLPQCSQGSDRVGCLLLPSHLKEPKKETSCLRLHRNNGEKSDTSSGLAQICSDY